jgi:nucleotide-binding universal stress UspA family protein
MTGAAPEVSGSGDSATTGAVVVGVSPKTGSPAALRWAAEEARLRGATLQAVMAWRPARPPSAPGGRPPAGLPSLDEDPAVTAEAALRDHVRTALGDEGDNVSCAAVKGNAVDALLSAAAGAQLLVIGEPRASKLAKEKSARFTAPQVVLQAPCPVVVMPPV